MNHTPGPWSYAVTSGTNYAKIFLHGLGRAGTIKGADSLRGYCGEANARLIAAAPDLLAALLSMVDNPGSEALSAARAAIEKAVT
jgi:hypothetical protein